MTERQTILLIAAVFLICIVLMVVQAAFATNDTPKQNVTITPWYPDGNITDTKGAARVFNITINRTADVRWLMNGTEVYNESDVNASSYRNMSAAVGHRNVTAHVCNENGSDTHTPILIYGAVQYADGDPSNVNVTVTNLNTSYNVTAMTAANSSYYQIRTSSAHIRSGDMLRFNASEGGQYSLLNYTVTDEDVEGGGFLKNFLGSKPDLVITEKSEYLPDSEYFTVSYKVENKGGEIANESNTSIYVDGVLVAKDHVGVLVPGDSYENTVGSFHRAYDKRNTTVRVCADCDEVVNESAMEDNNCMENELVYDGPLPNLYFYYFLWGSNPEVLTPDSKGQFTVYYWVRNNIVGENPDGWPCHACPTNTTIGITNVSVNGSATDIIVKEKVRGNDEIRLGPFTCSPGKEVTVNISLDGDNQLLEGNETDNFWTTTFLCPGAKPDLIITDHKTTWINKTNRTFNLTYTVENVGRVNATNSTTYILNTGLRTHPGCGALCTENVSDPVPPLAPGENYTNTTCPLRLCGRSPWWITNESFHTSINITADYDDRIDEADEENNYKAYEFGLPFLRFHSIWGKWISAGDKSFEYSYRIYNDRETAGTGPPKNCTLYAYVDGTLNATKTIQRSGNYLGHGQMAYKGSIGLTMPADKTPGNDTVNVSLRVEWDCGPNCTNSMDATFGGGACMGADGYSVSCGGTAGGVSSKKHITKSCTFIGDMCCPSGIMIEGDDIVVDGNGSGVIGAMRYGECNSAHFNPISKKWYDSTHAIWIMEGSRNITIKNMDIRNYCNGIIMGNEAGHLGRGAYNITVENCSIHDNGDSNRGTYGIVARNTDHVTIDNCRVYNNTGTVVSGNRAGGHGIELDSCDYSTVANSHIFNNRLSGIYASPTCEHMRITGNLVEDNGYHGASRFCTGINLHWRGGYGALTNSTVKGNTVRNNTGTGIYLTQGNTTIRDNVVTGCTNGTGVTGTGILVDGGWLNFLYNNTVCDNDGRDIKDKGSISATFGDENTCDTVENYDDEVTIGCTYHCDGVNGVCVGATRNFTCRDVVTENCTFDRAISCPLGDGLIAGADGVVIDGARYKLIGNYTGAGIVSNHADVVVRNLQVTNFSTGIMVEGTNNTIRNCTVRKNAETGINLSADNCTVCDTRIYDNLGSGIAVFGNYSTFTNNTAARNMGYGFYFSPHTVNSTIVTNFIGDNYGVDINATTATNITGDENTCDVTDSYWDAKMIEEKLYGCAYPWTPPDLAILNKPKPEWVDEAKNIYHTQYTIENIGDPNSRPVNESTSWLNVDLRPHSGADDLVGLLEPGENDTRRNFNDYEVTISDGKDTVTVCADGPDEIREINEADKFYLNTVGCYTVPDLFKGDEETNNCKTATFRNSSGGGSDDVGVCVCDDGWCDGVGRDHYTCGDWVEESCTFNGSMVCSPDDGNNPHGLFIDGMGVVIDGNGSTLEGAGDVAGVAGEGEPLGVYCGIGIASLGNVTVKNLEIKGFCTGIGIAGGRAGGHLIDNCKIHDNEGGHGIHLASTTDATIQDCEIYGNIWNDDHGCGGGGNGIFMYHSWENHIIDNKFYENGKSGIYIKYSSKRNNILRNVVYENVQAGIVVRCMRSNENIIEDNYAYENYGDGIFIGGCDNTIKRNVVEWNKAGHRLGDTNIEGGNGINMGRDGASRNNYVYNNTACYNEDFDITAWDESYGNYGDENTGDTTENYDDDGTVNCTYPCSNPDLTVTDKYEGWVGDHEDRVYNITYAIANVGCEAAPECDVHVWVDEDKYTGQVPALGIGGSYTNTIGDFTLSGDEDLIQVIVDPDDEISERDEGNNSRENTWYAMPDLAIAAFDVPRNLTLFGDSNASVTVKNIGTISTEDAFDVTLFVNDKKEKLFRVTGKLDSGESVDLSFGWVVLASNRLKVVADSEDEIDEWDEGNNEAMITKTLSGAPPGDPDDNDPTPHIRDGLSSDASDPSLELDPDAAGAGGDWEFDDVIGNESGSVCAAKERVSAHPFRSNPFFKDVSDVVVAYSGLAAMGALFIAALFLIGYRGEIRVHRRNGR